MSEEVRKKSRRTGKSPRANEKPKIHRNETSSKKKKRILVVGDWVIDENWFVGDYHSATSSRASTLHSRALVPRSGGVFGLCGAARLARALYWSGRIDYVQNPNRPNGQCYAKGNLRTASETATFDEVIALGIWGHRDEERLQNFFVPDAAQGTNPYELTTSWPNAETWAKKRSAGEHCVDVDSGNGSSFKPFGLRLVNYADVLVDSHTTNPETRLPNAPYGDADRASYMLKACSCGETDFSTARVVRVYRKLEDGSRGPVERIDWDRPLPDFNDSHREREWPLRYGPGAENDTLSFAYNSAGSSSISELPGKDAQANWHAELLLNRLKLQPSDIEYIAIKCLGRGVVSGRLVRALQKAFPNAAWFVSSKLSSPSWLADIPPEKMRIRIIPQPSLAVDSGVSNWWVESKMRSKDSTSMSRAAIDFLADSIDRSFPNRTKGAGLVLLPGGFSAVGLFWDGSTWNGWKYCLSTRPDRLWEAADRFGGATLAFAALIANTLETTENFSEQKELSKLAFTQGLYVAARWIANEELRSIGRGAEPSEAAYGPRLVPDESSKIHAPYRVNIEQRAISEVFWSNCKKRWEAALSGMGIVGGKRAPIIDEHGKEDPAEERRRIELWRAQTVLNNYIAITESKERAVRSLLAAARAFERDSRRPGARNVSCMLVADPGSGKSSLVKAAAAACKFDFRTYNITELVRRDEIANCFQDIVSAQARDRKKKILVFFDEINTKLEGQFVHEIFMAPLEDGVFLHKGNRIPIAPCFWVFADTASPDAVAGASKGRDFCSRLSNKLITLQDQRPGEPPDRLLATERVYIAIAMLKNRFVNVERVHERVVKFFFDHGTDGSIRELRQFINNMVDDQGGEDVTIRNFPRLHDHDAATTRLEDAASRLTYTTEQQDSWVRLL